jgi:hypothetical protein
VLITEVEDWAKFALACKFKARVEVTTSTLAYWTKLLSFMAVLVVVHQLLNSVVSESNAFYYFFFDLPIPSPSQNWVSDKIFFFL